MKPLLPLLACAVLAAAWPVAAQKPPPPSAATEIGELMKAGRHDDALARADARLKDNPRDAQVRFMRGVILAEQGKTVEAAAVFETLTQEFPELPEPHNNLATIYASRGELDLALGHLEMALRALPSYALAQENLGDLYLRLAERSYQLALQAQPGSEGVRAKLTLAREMIKRIITVAP